MRSKFLIIFLVVFLDFLGFGMVIPILPYYAVFYGASAVTVGLLAMCYSAMQFLFSPFWGRLSDKMGRRPVLLTCIFGIGCSMVIVGFAQSLMWLFIGRILAGFFGANISTAAAYIADVTSPEQRAKGMGLVGAALGLGFLFGPAAGGMLSHWGYGTAALAAAALAAVNFVFAIIWLHEPALPEGVRREHRSRFTLRTWWKTVTHIRTGFAIWLFFLATLGVAQIETTFALLVLARFGFDAHHAGFLMALIAACLVVIQGGLIGSLAKRFGEYRLVATGLLLMIMAMMAIAASVSLASFIVAIVVYGMGYGVTSPSLLSLATCGADDRQRGMVVGIYQSAGSLARILGPLMAGFFFDHFGVEIPFLAAAGCFLVAVGVAIAFHGRWHQAGGKVEGATAAAYEAEIMA